MISLDNAANVLVVGFGVTNRAVSRALIARGHTVTAYEDEPNVYLRGQTAQLGIEMLDNEEALKACLTRVDFVVPTPGLNENHVGYVGAQQNHIPLVSELDLVELWDDRPMVAITGTNGKTTVVELCTDALKRSGFRAVAAGNNELPLVAAINDPTTEMFVVEASSFRLSQTRLFAPQVGTWLNFAPDHLDVHKNLAAYEKAKSRIWRNLKPDGICVANALDRVVMAHRRSDRECVTYAGQGSPWRAQDDQLVGPQGPFGLVEDLWRTMPHDIEAALATAASVVPVGAELDALRWTYRDFKGLPHRIALVGEIDGSLYYNDSKATTPHATSAALRGFDKVVLIAGGQNKGVDLKEMAAEAQHVLAVVAIGSAAEEIKEAFASTHQATIAADIDDAVAQARQLAKGGTTVLLSPGCASFDAYENYRQRGEDFVRAVKEQQ